MCNDIEEIIRRLQELHPGVEVAQLKPRHAADDDGLWFFSARGIEVQLESSSGNCPFLLESSAHNARRYVQSIDEGILAIKKELGLR